MQGPTAGPRLFTRPYRISDRSTRCGRADRCLVDQGFRRPLDRSYPRVPQRRSSDVSVEDDRGALEGTLVSRLPCPLKNVLLAYDRWAYQWDRLEPGQKLGIAPHERDLQTVLKSFHAVKNKQNDTFVFQAQPFDPRAATSLISCGT